MNTKKGKKWSLSCVATSTAVLSFLVVSNNVLADDTDATQNVDGNNPVAQTQAVSGQTTASSTATQADPSKQPDYSATYVKMNSQNNGQDTESQNDSQNVEPSRISFKSVQGQPLSQAVANAPEQETSKNGVQATSIRADNPDVRYGGTFANDIKNYSSSNHAGFNLHPEDNELGYAAYFHIFANEAHLSTHTNGNVATGLLDGQVNFGTNIKEELVDYDVSYIQEIEKIAGSSFVSGGNTRTNKIVFGNGIEVDVSNPNRPLVTFGDTDEQVYIDHLTAAETYQDKSGKDPYIDFSDMFKNHLEPKSQELAGLEASDIVSSGNKALITNSQFSDPNNRVIDLTDMKPNADNQIVIYLAPDVLQGNTPLTIRGLASTEDGPTVIINVDTQGVTPYTSGSQIKVIYDDGSERNNHETEYFGDNHLLWNFYDSTSPDKLFDGKLDFNNTFQGSVLAPKADVTVHHNLDGNIVADKVTIKGESHRWDLQDNTNKDEDEEEFQTIQPLPAPAVPGIDPEDPEYPDGDGDEDDNDWEGEPDPDPEEPGEDGDWTDGDPDDEDNNGETPDPEDPDDEDNNGETPDTEDPDDEDNNDETPDTEKPGNEDNNEGTPDPETPVKPEEPGVNVDGNENTDVPEIDTNGDGIPDTPITNGSNNSSTTASNSTGSNGNTLPQTSAKSSAWLSVLGLALLSFLGIKKRKEN
ncbi:collagen-binding domain-containing protein [Companilactobacillus insicii]|uniref:collagen-binding domain-containing protein n=1 Tax=Companilactobacillus insicii TaxID=1732567 RepID=UPI0013DDE8C5|nr:collagen-binding domain-containing protein [Companilactobacillus insicii]